MVSPTAPNKVGESWGSLNLPRIGPKFPAIYLITGILDLHHTRRDNGSCDGMVRIKERYLLVNIVYPEELSREPALPDFVVLNQPTTDSLTPPVLLRAIKSEISNLFGDYGCGAVERSLAGENDFCASLLSI